MAGGFVFTGRGRDAAFAKNGMDGSNKRRGLFCGPALFVRAGVVSRQENQTEYSEEKMNACVAAMKALSSARAEPKLRQPETRFFLFRLPFADRKPLFIVN